MPFDLTWEPRGVYRRYYGEVTVSERRLSFDLICGDRRFDDLRYTVTDYLAAEHYEITPQATKEIAALHIAPLRTNPRILIAAVAVDARIVQAIRHFIALDFIEQPYCIFPTLHAARTWIADPGAAMGRG
jgi:hypothetical protein